MSERTIQWTDPALDDLKVILDRLYLVNPRAADRLADAFVALVASIGDYPEAGPALADMPAGHFRQRILAPYRLIYRLDDTTVWIVRIWHGRRDPTALDL